MARFFKQDEIDEFRECFNLYARKGQITNQDELAIIMKSLRQSPTSTELRRYLKQNGGKLAFPVFLDVMHEHVMKEKIPDEILKGFQEQDPRGTGTVPVKELKRLLRHWGDRLSSKEGKTEGVVPQQDALAVTIVFDAAAAALSAVEEIFRETNTPASGRVKYADFVKVVCAPVPDYY